VTATQPAHSPVNLATSVTHMPFGPASSWTYGNGVTDTRTFDLDYRMTSVTDTGTGNIQYLSYSYNAANRVPAITDHVSAAKNQTFTYDRTGQVTFASGSYGSASVTYDSNSNRLTAAGINYTYYAGTNRLKKWGTSNVTYTSTGNIASIGPLGVLGLATYNKANQLASLTVSGTTTGYNYDAFGQRLKLKTGTTPFQVQTYDQGGHMLTSTNAAAPPVETDYAYMDGLPIAAIQPAAATISALHTDNIGTVQRATNAAKTVVYTVDYTVCGGGTPTATITQDLRFPGQINDASGLNHNGARDMSKVFCTYFQADPIGLAGGLNPYVYAGNNPVTNIDPWGLVDVNLQEPGSPGYQMQQDYNDPRYLTVGAHGLGWGFTAKNPGSVLVYDLMTGGQSYARNFLNTTGKSNLLDNISLQDVADRIIASGWNTLYGPHKPVQLSACYAGEGGNSSFAAQLSKYLSRVTNAPVTVVGGSSRCPRLINI
jgi:RHS repeat-associated protein